MGNNCTKAGKEEQDLLRHAKEGHVDAVTQCVHKNVHLAATAQTWNGQSLWHLAARYGHAELLRALADAIRYNANAGPKQWRRLLSASRRFGHSTDAIIKHCVNLQDVRSQTPLHLACTYGHTECTELLVQLGASSWCFDELGGRTPLHYAASMGHVDCIRALLSHPTPNPGIDLVRYPNTARTRLVDIANDAGYTPLHYAAWAGNASSIRALVSFEANLTPKNVAAGSDWVQSGLKWTPLHIASFRGSVEVVKVILAAHVQCVNVTAADGSPMRRRDPRRQANSNRQLPYHVAVSRGHRHLTELLHPEVPYSFVLTPADLEATARLYGPAKLSVLAATALQHKLQADIERGMQAFKSRPIARTASGANGLPKAASTMALAAAAARAVALLSVGTPENSVRGGAAAAALLSAPGHAGMARAAWRQVTVSGVLNTGAFNASGPGYAGSLPSAGLGLVINTGRVTATSVGAADTPPPASATANGYAHDASAHAGRGPRPSGASNMPLGALAAALAPLPEPGSSSGASSSADGADPKAKAAPQGQEHPAPGALGRSPLQMNGVVGAARASEFDTADAESMRPESPGGRGHDSDPQPLPLPPAPISPFLGLPSIALPHHMATAPGLAAGAGPGAEDMHNAFAAFARCSADAVPATSVTPGAAARMATGITPSSTGGGWRTPVDAPGSPTKAAPRLSLRSILGGRNKRAPSSTTLAPSTSGTAADASARGGARMPTRPSGSNQRMRSGEHAALEDADEDVLRSLTQHLDAYLLSEGTVHSAPPAELALPSVLTTPDISVKVRSTESIALGMPAVHARTHTGMANSQAVGASLPPPPLAPHLSASAATLQAMALAANASVASNQDPSNRFVAAPQGDVAALAAQLQQVQDQQLAANAAVLRDALASLAEKQPEQLIKGYRILQLMHGVDLQDVLGVAPSNASGAGPGLTASAGVVGPLAADLAAAGAVSTSASAAAPGAVGAARPPAPKPTVAVRGSDSGALNSGPVASPFGAPDVQRSFSEAEAEAADAEAGGVGPSTERSVRGQASHPAPLAAALPEAPAAAQQQAAGGTDLALARANSVLGKALHKLSSRLQSELGDGVCGVCFDRPDFLRVRACGHRLCGECSLELCKLHSFKPALCPFCRGAISGFEA